MRIYHLVLQSVRPSAPASTETRLPRGVYFSTLFYISTWSCEPIVLTPAVNALTFPSSIHGGCSTTSDDYLSPLSLALFGAQTWYEQHNNFMERRTIAVQTIPIYRNVGYMY